MQYVFERIYRKRKQPRFYMISSEKKTARFTNNLDSAAKLDGCVKELTVRNIWKIFKVKVRALVIEKHESGYKLGKT